eukprot:2430728-Rhodomonas_salina.2
MARQRKRLAPCAVHGMFRTWACLMLSSGAAQHQCSSVSHDGFNGAHSSVQEPKHAPTFKTRQAGRLGGLGVTAPPISAILLGMRVAPSMTATANASCQVQNRVTLLLVLSNRCQHLSCSEAGPAARVVFSNKLVVYIRLPGSYRQVTEHNCALGGPHAVSCRDLVPHLTQRDRALHQRQHHQFKAVDITLRAHSIAERELGATTHTSFCLPKTGSAISVMVPHSRP